MGDECRQEDGGKSVQGQVSVQGETGGVEAQSSSSRHVGMWIGLLVGCEGTELCMGLKSCLYDYN